MEMLDPLDSIFTNQKKLANSTINIYIGNNDGLTSLVRGDSGADILEAMVTLFWGIAEANSIDSWVGRVSSQGNPDDLPTRHVPAPFMVCTWMEFNNLSNLLKITLKWGDFTNSEMES